ncbi:MAG: glutamate formimidoyltransferase [Bacteroidia bacterium]|nr:glutamate formimidoyltransferase [Bacteroidia bacterium]
MKTGRLIECVPNFSEGRDKSKINDIADAITQSGDVRLLHVDSGYDANRTVFTFIGSPEAVVEAVVRSFRTARQLCDMENHLGTHPRIGLMDVCPLIPLDGITLNETVHFTHEIGKRLEEEFDQTSYLYATSATREERKKLETIRKGEYEGLKRKLKDPDWKPDYGSHKFLPKTGACVIGARPFLIAYNVNLNTREPKVANEIAKRIRTSGYYHALRPNGLKEHFPGLLPEVKALGWYVEEYKTAQVSMNLTNFEVTGMHTAMEACRKLAKEYEVEVTGSELIGLVPLNAMLLAGKHYSTENNLSEESMIKLAINKLGLEDIRKFDPHERIIEYKMDNPDPKQLSFIY